METMILVALLVVALVGLYDELVVSRRARLQRSTRLVRVSDSAPTVTFHLAAWTNDRETPSR